MSERSLRRTTFVAALGLSVAAHAAVFAWEWPEDRIAEAGSGSGAPVEGSIEAVLGTAIPVEAVDADALDASASPVPSEARPVETTENAPLEATPSPTAEAVRPVTVAEAQPPATPALEPVAQDVPPSSEPAAEAAPVRSVETADRPARQELAAVEPEAATEAPRSAEAPAPAEDDFDLPAVETATDGLAEPQAETVDPAAATPLAPPTAAVEAKPVETRSAAMPPRAVEAEPVEKAPPSAEPDRPTLAEARPVEAEPVEAQPVETAETPAPRPLDAPEVAEVEPVAPEAVEVTEAEPDEPPPVPTAKPEIVAAAEPERRRPPRAERTERREPPAKSRPAAAGNAEADSRAGASRPQNTQASGEGLGRAAVAGAGDASLSDYRGKVSAKLRRTLRYPRSEVRRDNIGVTWVTFKINPDGSIRGLRLLASSGNEVLDGAALASVQRAAPFPPLPGGRAEYEIDTPIRFTLRR